MATTNTIEPPATFHCAHCGQDKPVHSDGGTGYGERDGAKVCYACCGELDRAEMIETGRATLYLTCEPAHYGKRHEGRSRASKVSNWPGTLSFPASSTYGLHNIAGYRYDVSFRGPDGFWWHGVTYGDNTQICRCKRTKRRIDA